MPLALFADLDTGSPQQWYVHPDHLDRPSKMTDASQAVVWDVWYTTYGEVQSITGSATLPRRIRAALQLEPPLRSLARAIYLA
jgi:hypothetical protein